MALSCHGRHRSLARSVVLTTAVAMVMVACSATPTTSHRPTTPPPSSGDGVSPIAGPGEIHAIKHVIVVMQENRSFDSYFGTFPGADGIPSANGVSTVCVPVVTGQPCARPYADHADVNGGGPHGQNNATADIDGGEMDGFVGQLTGARKGCADQNNPACTNSATPDVLGYHTQSDIPNYWSYASQYVLQDHMFEPNASWSLPAHLFTVSEWSAACTQHNDPASCTNALQSPGTPQHAGLPNAAISAGSGSGPVYAWTDMTYLLHKNNVSWGYYVVAGTEPDCANDAALSCGPVKQNAKTPGIWNPLPYFDTVRADGQEEIFSPLPTSTPRPIGAPCLPCPGSCLPGPSASTHPRPSPSGSPTSPASLTLSWPARTGTQLRSF